MAGDAQLTKLYEEKVAAYARFGNGVVAESALALLPPGGRVLDVGCASGGLLAVLRERAGYTAGLELSRRAATDAAKVADEVVTASIDAPDLPFETASFDLVVLADVLEHLVDPAAALGRAVDLVRPGGAVVISVPNIAHWRARLVLMRGQWPSEESGTFDSGHLRFFTLERLESLVTGAGLEGIELRPVVPALRNHLPPLARMPEGSRHGIEAAWQRLGHARPNLFGYQLVATARRVR